MAGFVFKQCINPCPGSYSKAELYGREGIRVDTVSRRRGTAGGSRRAVRSRTKRPTQKSGAEGDKRRLIQLLVSLALFLLVYIGRGVFPSQIEAWRTAMCSNVDFAAAFQEFGRTVSDGGPVWESLEILCVEIFGGAPEQDEPTQTTDMPHNVTLLSQTPGAGRAYLSSHGVLQGSHAGKTADEPVPPAVEPSGNLTPSEGESTQPPALATAIAQEYTDDGVKLPSNVSFAFYELGLSETVVPVSGPVTSAFGYRDSPVNGKNEFHLALDIGAAEGTEIGAFADGVVEYIGKSDEFGQYLKIRHANQVSSFYAHCSRLLVHKGDTVSAGQTVALVGQTGNATGPHLHLTIEKDNIRLNPAYYVDPA